jgi:hypothetical protein
MIEAEWVKGISGSVSDKPTYRPLIGESSGLFFPSGQFDRNEWRWTITSDRSRVVPWSRDFTVPYEEEDSIRVFA